MVFLLFVVGCSKSSNSATNANAAAAKKLNVAVSIPPIAYFVDRIAGDYCDVTTMVPTGQSAHSYEPTPRQVTALHDAKLIFTIGMPLEERFLRSMPRGDDRPNIVSLRDGIALRDFTEGCSHDDHDHAGHDHDHGIKDPHFWLSPENAAFIAKNIAAAINAVFADDAEMKAAISGNLAKLLSDLSALTDECDAALQPFAGRKVLVFHPSYGYFFDRYEIEQIAVEVSGREPSPREITEMVSQARAANARVMYVQPQEAGRSARVIADELGVPVVTFDPLAYDYIENLRSIIRRIDRDLRNEKERAQLDDYIFVLSEIVGEKVGCPVAVTSDK